MGKVLTFKSKEQQEAERLAKLIKELFTEEEIEEMKKEDEVDESKNPS